LPPLTLAIDCSRCRCDDDGDSDVAASWSSGALDCWVVELPATASEVPIKIYSKLI